MGCCKVSMGDEEICSCREEAAYGLRHTGTEDLRLCFPSAWGSLGHICEP